MRLLIVDDDSDLLEALAQILVYVARPGDLEPFEPDEIRSHALSLMTVAEAAVMDAAVASFLVARINIGLEEATYVVGDFRVHRAAQGERSAS